MIRRPGGAHPDESPSGGRALGANQILEWVRLLTARTGDQFQHEVRGRTNVIDKLIDYILYGRRGFPWLPDESRIPRALGEYRLMVDTGEQPVPLVVARIERFRNPLLPWVEEASVRSVVVSGFEEQALKQELPPHEFAGTILYFVFTSRLSVDQNLRDFTVFVAEELASLGDPEVLRAQQRA